MSSQPQGTQGLTDGWCALVECTCHNFPSPPGAEPYDDSAIDADLDEYLSGLADDENDWEYAVSPSLLAAMRAEIEVMIGREEAVSRAHGMTLSADRVEAAWRRRYPAHAEFYAATHPTDPEEGAMIAVPVTTEPPVQAGPAPDQPGIDRATLARNAALNLVAMTAALDPAGRVEMQISPFDGDTTLHLLRPSTLQAATGLADRLGLTEHTWLLSAASATRHHHWDGARGGFRVRVTWLEDIAPEQPEAVPECTHDYLFEDIRPDPDGVLVGECGECGRTVQA